MSHDLKEQIRHLAVLTDAEQTPVTVDEIRGRLDERDDTEPMIRPAGGPDNVLSRGAWPAVVAAAVVLVIFGVFAWVFPGDEPVPPADSLPDPMDRELGYYVPAAVPDGFVLQDVETSPFGGGSVLYVRDVGSTWLPGDGGFEVRVPSLGSAGLPENPEEYLGGIMDSVPGSTRVEVGGRPGVIHEIEWVDGPVATSLVSLVVVDTNGSVFEISASGMSQQEVVSVGANVERVSVEDFVAHGFDLRWDISLSATHDGYQYETPDQIEDLAAEMDVVLGLDVLSRSGLARGEGEETTVVTTEDGSVVESEDGPTRSRNVGFYLDLPDDDIESALTALENTSVDVSPHVSERFTAEYLDDIQDGEIISDDPYVVQAPSGPEPQFDTSQFGEELPLVPATSLDALPDWAVDPGVSPETLHSTADRPIIVIGTARQPGSDAEPVTVLLWFTEMPGVNVGLSRGEGIASGGGNYPLDRYGTGVRGSSQIEGSSEVTGEMAYSVPLETAAVQIVTESSNYWQRPNGGYGAITWGDTVDRPTSIVAYDAEANEIGQWAVPDQ